MTLLISNIRWLKRIAPLIPTPVFWLDLGHHLTGANKAFYDHFGLQDDTPLLRRDLGNILSFEIGTKVNARCRAALKTGKTQVVEVKIHHRNYISLLAPFRIPNGEVLGVIGICIELPHECLRQSAQLERVAGVKREKVAMLARKMAHDLQSPLAALLMMLHQCDELPEEKRLLISNAASSIKEMTSHLLANYRTDEQSDIVQEEKKPIALARFLKLLMHERRYQYQNLPINFNLLIQAQAHTAVIVAQASQLSRAVTNIINNAVDALSDVHDGQIVLELTVDLDRIKLTITDNGCGMPRDLLHKIKSRINFTANKQHGHGLGLAQVWDMVERNAISMDVYSEPGRGTTFCLLFALAPKSDWLIQENISRYQVQRIKTAEFA